MCVIKATLHTNSFLNGVHHCDWPRNQVIHADDVHLKKYSFVNIYHFRNEKSTGDEMCPAIDSGIVTGDARVSYWPIFFSFPPVVSKAANYSITQLPRRNYNCNSWAFDNLHGNGLQLLRNIERQLCQALALLKKFKTIAFSAPKKSFDRFLSDFLE